MAGRSCNITEMKHVYEVTVPNYTVLVTVTSHPDAITEWINGVKADGNTGVRKVGFEIELTYSFYPIGTVQLCVGRRCLIMQLGPHISPFPPSFSEFLSDSNNIFMGFQMEWKLKKLRIQVPIGGVEQIRTMDVMKDVPRLLNNKQVLLALLPLYGMGPEMVENDWGRIIMLSEVQVHYACMDVLFNLQAARIAQNLLNKPAPRS